MKNTYVFIVNARIGKSKINRLQRAVRKYFHEKDFQICLTEYGGHAQVITRDMLQKGYANFVAVGGDGTVNEVIQVLANTDITFGIIPTGSGNGLARHCSIPLKIEEAVQLIVEGKGITIDLGKVNDIFFISNAGIGFDAVVCNDIKQTKSRGLKMYIMKVIQHYFSYQSDTYAIDLDGKCFEQKAFFLNVANGKEFGYGFQIAPEATLQDGYLDIIMVKKINIWNGLSFVIDGWRKKLITNQNCIYIRAKKIKLKGKNLRYFQTDGDAHDCQGQCDIEIWPRALRLIVPQHIQNV